jgi:hypothetical protein
LDLFSISFNVFRAYHSRLPGVKQLVEDVLTNHLEPIVAVLASRTAVKGVERAELPLEALGRA